MMSGSSEQYPKWIVRPALWALAIGSVAGAVVCAWTAVQDVQLVERGTRGVARIDSAVEYSTEDQTDYRAIARVMLRSHPTSADWLCCARTMTLDLSAEQYNAYRARRAHRGEADEEVVEVLCASADGPCQTTWALQNHWPNRLVGVLVFLLFAVIAAVKLRAPRDAEA